MQSTLVHTALSTYEGVSPTSGPARHTSDGMQDAPCLWSRPCLRILFPLCGGLSKAGCLQVYSFFLERLKSSNLYLFLIKVVFEDFTDEILFLDIAGRGFLVEPEP